MSGEGVETGGSSRQHRRDWSWLFGAGISLVALTLAVSGMDLDSFWTVIRRGLYLLLVPAFALQVCGIAFRSEGWRSLLGPPIGFRRAFAAINEGYLLNNVLPFRLGELARAYLVGFGTPIGTSRALGTIVVERLIDLSIAVASVLLTIPIFAPPGWATRVTAGVGLLLVGLIVFVLLALQTRQHWLAWIGRLPGRLGPRLAGILDRFALGLEAVRDRRRLLRAALWLFIGWSVAWLQFGLYLRMFGASGSLGVSLFGLGVIALSAALPSSPGAVGVMELGGVAALTFLGYPREVALGVTVSAHLVQFTTTVVIGAVALTREGRSLGGLARAARGLVLRPAG
jgi:uncharacterized protein (TIRG00374 family)